MGTILILHIELEVLHCNYKLQITGQMRFGLNFCLDVLLTQGQRAFCMIFSYLVYFAAPGMAVCGGWRRSQNKQDHQRWRYHRRLWIIKVHRITGIRNTWNHQIPLDHLSPCFHLKWPLDHQTMKDNVNLIILLDHNHQTWIKPIFSINYTTRRKKNWTLTDLEPPTYLQMGLKNCH